jgi:hypothetical protein
LRAHRSFNVAPFGTNGPRYTQSSWSERYYGGVEVREIDEVYVYPRGLA